MLGEFQDFEMRLY